MAEGPRDALVSRNSATYKTSHLKQEAFEKCWAHSPLRAAAHRIAIHQVSLLSHAACASMSTTNDDDDNNDNA